MKKASYGQILARNAKWTAALLIAIAALAASNMLILEHLGFVAMTIWVGITLAAMVIGVSLLEKKARDRHHQSLESTLESAKEDTQ